MEQQMQEGTKKLYEKKCAICGRIFWGSKRQIYCSVNCRLKAHRQRMRMQDAQKGDLLVQVGVVASSSREVATTQESLASLRIQKCSHCGEEIEGMPTAVTYFFSCKCGNSWTISADITRALLRTLIMNARWLSEDQKRALCALIQEGDAQTGEE